MGNVCRWVLLALVMLLTPQVAEAEQRLALVIGNGKYAVGPLDNPSRDAELMAKVLSDSGFQVTHLSDLTYREFQRAVVQFGRNLQAAGNDTVGTFFYAGHAIQANGENYLVPVDADIQDILDLEIQTLRVATLMKSLEAAGNRLNLVVLDACRNNPFKSLSRSGSRGLAKVDAPHGTLLAYSTAPGDVAADGTGRNSPYTAALARMIQTPGVPVEQVFKRVRIEVMEKTGNRQVPWESSSLTGDFFFLKAEPVSLAPASPTPAPAAPPPAATDRDEEIEFWKSIAAGNDPALFQSYLQVYPNGTFANLARQRIDALMASQQARATQEAEQARQLEAQQFWDEAKDTDDPAVLQAVVDRYEGTVYAQLAEVKLQAMQSRSQVAAASSSDDADRDRLFWQSIQGSADPADYRAYLDQFPDGTFAAIARNRLENGPQPQVAALGDAATASHPYDGRWRLTWTVVGGYYGGARWCSAGETGTKVISVENGQFDGSLKSNYFGTAYIKISIDQAGGANFHARVPGWSVGTTAKTFRIEGDGFDDLLSDTGYCHARIEMRRQ